MIDMDNLLHGYSALQSTSLLQFPSQLPFEAVHDFLLHSILLNPHFKAYPPSDQYQYIFWKWAIHHLEAMSGGEAGVAFKHAYHLLEVDLWL
jgi:protein-lysine N-methyltransferase EEF2KMT